MNKIENMKIETLDKLMKGRPIKVEECIVTFINNEFHVETKEITEDKQDWSTPKIFVSLQDVLSFVKTGLKSYYINVVVFDRWEHNFIIQASNEQEAFSTAYVKTQNDFGGRLPSKLDEALLEDLIVITQV